jgi:hypothetical protein
MEDMSGISSIGSSPASSGTSNSLTSSWLPNGGLSSVGAPLRAWQNIRVLATRGPVSVFSFGERHDGVDTMPGVERWVHINEDDYPQATLCGFARVMRWLHVIVNLQQYMERRLKTASPARR